MTTALLLVGHGSRHPDTTTEMQRLVTLVADRTGVLVGHGWIEIADPPAVTAGQRLVAAGAQRLVLVPLLLFRAYHATVDLPAVAENLRALHPGLQVRFAQPLGVDPALVGLAARRVGAPAPTGEGLLVASAGTSDPDAHASAVAAARLLAERTGHGRMAHALVSMAVPGTDTAVAALAGDGCTSVALWSWSLLAGRLAASACDAARDAAGRHGLGFRDAGRFGPAPEVADVLAARFREAAA